MLPEDRRKVMEEIRRWESKLEYATDSGIARWIVYHIALLKKELEMLEEK
jgi:hypothetical protein